jgi:branched-chain amino acid transport system ATP-binding protein
MGIEVKNLVVGYTPEVDILKGISLSASDRKVTCVFGPNGSGKSTLLKAIYGILKPKDGEIFFNGKKINGMKPYELVNIGLGYIPQERSLFLEHTVYENLKLSAWNFRKDEEKVEKVITEALNLFPDLKGKLHAKASKLSGGQQRMIEFSRAIISGCRAILVDEPTAGLAPIPAKHVYETLEKMKKEGITMLLVDQNIRLALSIADYVYMLNYAGEIEREGQKSEFEKELQDLVKKWI